MAFVGSLITTVKANTKPFNKNLKKAGKRTKSFKSQLKSLAKGGAKFAAVLGGVAVAALAAYTLKAFKAIDATKKLADELEIATSDLISYQLAAGLSGTNTETLNKALQRMARTVGEARSGITTGSKALEDFGINIKDLRGLTTSEIFEEFAERISRIEDPMERAAKSALIFGKAGQKLLNFLSLGKTGLANVKAEAVALGLAFDEVDAKKVEDANDAILKIQTVAEGLGNTIAIELAPFVTKLATDIANFIKEAGGIKSLVIGPLETLIKTVKATKEAFDLAGEAAKFLLGGITPTTRKAIKDVDTQTQKLNKTLAMTRELAVFEKQAKAAQALRFELEDIIEAQKKIEEAGKKAFSSMITEAEKVFEETRTPLEKIEKEIARIKELFEAGVFTGIEGAFDRKLKELQDTKKDIEKALATEAEDKDRKKVIEEATKIFEQTRTPLEKVSEEMARVFKLLEAGVSGALEEGLIRKLDELEKAKKAIKKALFEESEARKSEKAKQDELKKIKELKKVKDKLEARDAKEFEGGFRRVDTKNINIKGLERFGGIEKKKLDEAKKTNTTLEKIAKNTENSTNGAVAQ